MSRLYAYEREPYRTRLEVTVSELGDDRGRPFVVLDDTILYPEGGGQPADRGRLGTAAIVDVQVVEAQIRHYLEVPLTDTSRTLELDWSRRYDHMQQHTAQHLLTAVAADRYGWETTSFHLGAEVCDIEIDARSTGEGELAGLEAAVNAEVRAARSITARRVEPEALAALAVRSRGLPAGYRGSVRVVEIEGIDRNTCGGTHLASTAEIESVKLLGTEGKRGGSVLRWLAGGRVRRRLGDWEARGARLRRALGAADSELVGLVERKLEALKRAGQRHRALTERLAEAVAEALAARQGQVVEAHFEDGDAAFLQGIARRFAASEHAGVALLTADGDKGCCFVLAAGGRSRVDLQMAGGGVAAALAGRGGGAGNLFQGKAESLAGRAAALESLARV